MCPGCLASVAMMITGVISTGGLTALLMKKFRFRRNGRKEQP
jgi:hypothetical protein